MNHNQPTIEIIRNSDTLRVNAIMPVWTKKDSEGKIELLIPLLGEDVVTCALNEEDAEIAINEVFKAFCLVSEKHGMGLENELEYIGWEKVETIDKNKFILIVPSPKPILERVMETGDNRLLSVAI